jgi:hypothetical protein
MRRYRIVVLAWALQVLAWFLTVIKDGVTFPHGLPGWEALRVALNPIWPTGDMSVEKWYLSVLTSASGLTNLVMVGSLWVMLRPSRAASRAFAWAATIAFLINASWYVFLFGEDRVNLRVGYFLWWLSFGLLAGALFHLSGSQGREESGREV